MKIIQCRKFIPILLILLSVYSYPQTDVKTSLNLTGNLITDSKISLEKFENDRLIVTKFQTGERKSPIKAGLFSAIVPGAGQFYNGDYLLTALFTVAEATLISFAVIYNNKGNNKTDDFQKYADKNWSIDRYADWTLNHLNSLNPDLPHDESYYRSRVFQNGKVVLSELNNLEIAIDHGYSHNLPPHGEQQYYEEIGKYPQFSSGWDDFSGDDYHNLSPHFLNYSEQRGDANDLYTVSTRAVAGIYINHILSAIEAAWGASRFNQNLSVKMRINQLNYANRTEFIPTMNLRYSF